MNIREQRHTQGITLKHLADLTGSTEAYLSKVERGHVTPSKPLMLALTHVLTCSPIRPTSLEKNRRKNRGK